MFLVADIQSVICGDWHYFFHPLASKFRHSSAGKAHSPSASLLDFWTNVASLHVLFISHLLRCGHCTRDIGGPFGIAAERDSPSTTSALPSTGSRMSNTGNGVRIAKKRRLPMYVPPAGFSRAPPWQTSPLKVIIQAQDTM